MPRKPRNATRTSEEPDTLPNQFTLGVRRIQDGWAVVYAFDKPPSVASGSFGLLFAILGALKSLARGGQ